jgi:hypothetical protein
MNLYYITEPIEWEDFEEDDDVIDLRAYNIVGGVFHFDLMQLPPQPKICNKWTITRCKLSNMASEVAILQFTLEISGTFSHTYGSPPPRHRILAILFRLFGFLAPKNIYFFGFLIF